MGKLIRTIETRVVGVSYKNDDGSSRQQIISELYEGEDASIEYFEYNGEPAFAVLDSFGNQIGNLSRDLAADIYRKYNGCYFNTSILRITGDETTKYLGCVVSIEVYEEAPEESFDNVQTDFVADSSSSVDPSVDVIAQDEQPESSNPQKRLYKFYSTVFTVLCIILFLIGLLLLFASPLSGIGAIILAILSFIFSRHYRKK